MNWIWSSAEPVSLIWTKTNLIVSHLSVAIRKNVIHSTVFRYFRNTEEETFVNVMVYPTEGIKMIFIEFVKFSKE